MFQSCLYRVLKGNVRDHIGVALVLALTWLS